MRDEAFEWRMNNWAKRRLRDQSQSNGYTSVNYDNFGMGDAPRDAYEKQLTYIIDTDADEIDRAVVKLEPTLRETVEVFYMHAGNVIKRARRLGIGVATLYERMTRARAQIKANLTEHARAAQAERERVEKLQRERVA